MRSPFPGNVSSTNYPEKYPNNLQKTQTIKVPSDKILRLEFVHFEVVGEPGNCESEDYVKIMDGNNGEILMDKSCGYSSRDPSDYQHFQPPILTTEGNTVEILFYTGGKWTSTGWRISWTAVTPGSQRPSDPYDSFHSPYFTQDLGARDYSNFIAENKM